ncbi:MAG: MraY family glycosyltransferase [Patescibacteria group bacterium]
MFYILPFIFSFLISVFLTGVARRLGCYFGIVSVPRPRDVHKVPVPRIGGLAIFTTFILVALVYFLYVVPEWAFATGKIWGIDYRLGGIAVGGLILVVAMLVDDVRGLGVRQKFLFQFLSVVAVIGGGVGIDFLSNPFGGVINLNSVYLPIMTVGGTTYHFSLWSDLLTLVWLVGMMNVMNFIDGVDGLAGGISIIAAFTVFLLSVSIMVNQPGTALLAIILAGATAGFLVWNFPPAKIFMGDTGSMFLGYMLGTLALISGGKLATAFLVMGFPIIDGILVAGARIIRRQNPFTTPDKTHLHHRFLRAGFTPRQAILSLYMIAVAFGYMAIFFKTMDKVFAAFVLVVLVVVLAKFLNYLANKRLQIQGAEGGDWCKK